MMKLPRKLKKKLKKFLPIIVATSTENLRWILLEDQIRVANSIIYLGNPDRGVLIKWWDTHYPNDIKAKVICKQNFFKRLPDHYHNYVLHCINTSQIIKY